MHAYYIEKKLCMHHKLKIVSPSFLNKINLWIRILLFYSELKAQTPVKSKLSSETRFVKKFPFPINKKTRLLGLVDFFDFTQIFLINNFSLEFHRRSQLTCFNPPWLIQ